MLTRLLSADIDHVDQYFYGCLVPAISVRAGAIDHTNASRWGVELMSAADRVAEVRALAGRLDIDAFRYTDAWHDIRPRLLDRKMSNYEYHALWLRNLHYLYNANTEGKAMLYYIDRIAYLAVLTVAWQYREQLRARWSS